MYRRMVLAVVAFFVAFAVAQLIRPGFDNPSTDPSRSIEAHESTASGLVPVLDRACNDCHSNRTNWPGYARVAPLSWVMASAVAEGRKAVNFSEWGAYSPSQRQTLLAASCDDVTSGKMPGGPWTALHPEAKLSPRDIEIICGASRRQP